jgi:transposase
VSMYCGIDWAEGHHDIALLDDQGSLLAKRRITESVSGFSELTELLASFGDTDEDPIPVAIETPRGLLVAALRSTGRPVYAINPISVARYRERHSTSRSKSDHADAILLANILRTDAHVHRRLPQDSNLAQAITVLARAHQDATWRRTKAQQELRAVLREFYPCFLAAFSAGNTNLASSDARAILAIAPTPATAAALTRSRITTALKRGGRQRRLADTATRIQEALRRPQLRQPPLVEDAMGQHVLALLAILDAACCNVERLGKATAEAFRAHPDHHIISGFPAIGDTTGARLLGEIGDDRNRFSDARALKAYAGSAPITRASGRSLSVTRRRIKNNRLAATGFVWTFMAITNSPAARAHYDHRKQLGDGHAAALRHLFNRYLGQLHHCLTTNQAYDEHKAFPQPVTATAA